jgi:hypothetical protein
MEYVKGIATFHGNNPPDAVQSAGGLIYVSATSKTAERGRPPFDSIFIMRLT